MLGAVRNIWRGRSQSAADDLALALSPKRFDVEIARERMRASRRSIPFCLITVDVGHDIDGRRAVRKLLGLLHRNTRMTDVKGQLGRRQFGVLLVDTPEMGGRACLDRLSQLLEDKGMTVKLGLRVHDPEGFDSDDPPPGSRRIEDPPPDGRDSREPSTPEPLVHGITHAYALKRLVDVAGAAAGLLFGGPILLAAMAAVKLTSPGPVLFRQTREGHLGRPFTIYKLRTMIVNAERRQSELREQNHRDGPAFKIAHDPRLTRVGYFLRSTCLDELPQLYNVLRGDMSLVGPRPLPWTESRACRPWHRRRLDVRPGLTCHWQVNKQAAKDFDDWMRMDLRYVNHQGLWSDLNLIARTITVPVLGRGSQ